MEFPVDEIADIVNRGDQMSSFHSRSRSKRSRETSSTSNGWTVSPEKAQPIAAGKKKQDVVRRCTHCASEKTPQWRTGPHGLKDLCNACGVRFKSGRLLPEYRPAASPTFVLTQHSNSHRKVMELQRSKKSKGTLTISSESNEQVCEKSKQNADGKKRDSLEAASEQDSVKRCTHCASEKTPQWRTGPLGLIDLCNACGVRYRSGRLVPEYRPAASPTFVLTEHSNSQRKVTELRRQKEILRQQQQL
ncbi:GATA transcription factor 2-like [Impatiens glandulifera]|uniref:GATA transcription factor 2-like n=1 Tax=Impatiens glandulifera TaxID=253017 RepID=UPI001FB06911|nr:GATA transcription factor 2-like [Impatiens glandulifera]